MSKQSWLKKQVPLWVEKEIIQASQAEQIVAFYPKKEDRLISILLLLGAILLGAGIILFFASNWDYFPKIVKVSIVLLLLILFYLGSHLTDRKYPGLSRTLTLLGCIMFGSGIWLIAQIFHISSHFPNGLLLWLLGVLPAAFLLKEELPLGLSALLLAAWVLAEQSLSLPVIIAALLLFAVVYYLTYTLQSNFGLVVSLISAVIFINTEAYLLMADHFKFGDASSGLIPLLLLLLGSWLICMSKHPINQVKDFSFIYSLLGVLISGVSLTIMAFPFFTDCLLKLHHFRAGWLWFLAASLIGAILGTYAVTRQKTDYQAVLKEDFPALATLALILLMLVIPFPRNLLIVILNLFMFVWALSIIFWGFQIQNHMYFTLGIIAFNIDLITEYCSFFWRMLPKSLFFIAGGIILIAGGALMERKRRKVILSWKGKEVTTDEERL